MNSSKRVFLFVLTALACLVPAFAWAQAPSTDDAYAILGSTKTYGNADILNVANPSTNTYMRFDLSVYPPLLTSASIQKATLKLYAINITTAGNFYVCMLASNQPWNEDTIMGTNVPGCNPAVAPIVVTIPPGQDADYILVDVTPIVQYWYANPGSNNGVGLMTSSSGRQTLNVNISFVSKESTAT